MAKYLRLCSEDCRSRKTRSLLHHTRDTHHAADRAGRQELSFEHLTWYFRWGVSLHDPMAGLRSMVPTNLLAWAVWSARPRCQLKRIATRTRRMAKTGASFFVERHLQSLVPYGHLAESYARPLRSASPSRDGAILGMDRRPDTQPTCAAIQRLPDSYGLDHAGLWAKGSGLIQSCSTKSRSSWARSTAWTTAARQRSSFSVAPEVFALSAI